MKALLPIYMSVAFLTGCATIDKTPLSMIPDGWRIATQEDAIDDWAVHNSPNKVIADFNGDGKNDSAEILIGNKGHGYLVLAQISEGSEVKSFNLDEGVDGVAQTQSIHLAEPSNEVWESACQKGYWDCAENEIRQFKITKPSIMHCYIEKACTIYMWSDRNKNFTKIPLSD